MSVVFHKWKFAVGDCYPEHAHFYWICSHQDIDAFRWLLRRIKECQDEVIHMKASSQSFNGKVFSFHIFVTGVPDNPQPVEFVDDSIGFWGLPTVGSRVEKHGSSWTERDLYKEMKCPKSTTSQWDNVTLSVGRPDWTTMFTGVSQSSVKGDVGVLFCGNRTIYRDLQKNCHQFNKLRREQDPSNHNFFKLHQEVFV
jgi:Ferric reductase NAD binding domain